MKTAKRLFKYLEQSNKPAAAATVWLVVYYAISAPNTILPGGRVWEEALFHVRIYAFSPFAILFAVRLIGAIRKRLGTGP